MGFYGISWTNHFFYQLQNLYILKYNKIHPDAIASHFVHFLKFLSLLFHLPVSIGNRWFQVRKFVNVIRRSLFKINNTKAKLDKLRTGDYIRYLFNDLSYGYYRFIVDVVETAPHSGPKMS